LASGPSLALCGASDPATQARIDAMIAEDGEVNFAGRFLSDPGLSGRMLALP
jgi:type IV secretion system protein TrbE